MISKCPQCDLTVQTITSIVLWLDVIVCGCISLVQLSQAQDYSCSNRTDCSIHYRIAELLIVNIVVGFVALCGVRKRKPTLLLPYTIFKILVIIFIVITFIFWRELSDLHRWLLARIDLLAGIALFIIFAFQIYTVFVMIWSYNQIARMLSACRPTKSFKSVISIWIGGDESRTNMCSNNVSHDSTCIIETESR